ncbi:MAG: MurR/RpiR family transcriptional regulator [Rhodovulum sulfidophilum]|uniref:MurR/RpiR family transcriptional regulator n=1 Tax=Rhodovulum sulfidophilum TaxID=35806 RepID=A0A2W5Q5R6_RHOSU|nr:MAG: MurR/RpiR family transcriptional regulator [Rhodovulum sulfidophilum]
MSGENGRCHRAARPRVPPRRKSAAAPDGETSPAWIPSGQGIRFRVARLPTGREIRRRRSIQLTVKFLISIAERIHSNYPHMTGALQKFADFVLAEPVKVARISIHEAVKDLDVSVASANRFARAIGYSGYAEFRTELIRSFEPAFDPVKRLQVQVSRSSTSLDVFKASMAEDISNVRSTMDALSDDRANQAVEAVLSARSIVVFGLDNGASCAAILCNELQRLRRGVTCIANYGGAIGVARHFTELGRDDLAIAIAFPNYIRDVIQLASLARARGTRVLAITDSHQSPLAPLADINLFCRAERQFGSMSNASAVTIIEALTAAVAHRTERAVELAEQYTALELPWLERPR